MFPSSDTVGQLATALAQAQAELVNPPKTLTACLAPEASGARQSYRYAPLSTGLTIVRKALGRHHLALVQTTQVDPDNGAVDLTTVLVHGSGEWIATRWPVCNAEARRDPKLMGAALTYARRYSLFALVGLAGEDDLDAPGSVRQPTGARVPRTAGIPSIRTAPTPRRRRPLSRSTAARVIPIRPVVSELTRPEIEPAHEEDDPLPILKSIGTEAALLEWAVAVLPRRRHLDEATRSTWDAAFRAKTAELGVSLDLLVQPSPGSASPPLPHSEVALPGDHYAP